MSAGKGVIVAVQAPARSWKAEGFKRWLEKKGLKTDVILETSEKGDLLVAVQDAGEFEKVAYKSVAFGIVFRIGWGRKAVPWYDRDVFESLFGGA